MADSVGPRRHVKFDNTKSKNKTPPKHEFKITENPEQAGRKIWVVLGFLASVALVVFAARSWVERPDPHYVVAQKLVNQYQSGRAPTARNYNNTIYDEALSELDQVDPQSISADPARELRDDILHGREAFLARRQSEKSTETAIINKRQKRQDRNVEAYQRARANPQVDYPECDDEEAGHKHSGQAGRP